MNRRRAPFGPGDLRKPLVFALQALPLFGLSLYVYVRSLNAYLRGVTTLANWILAWTGAAIEIRIGGEGRWHMLVHATRQRGEWEFSTGTGEFNLHAFLGIAILSALLLATPGSVGARAALWLKGLLLLYALHVLFVAGTIFAMGRLCARPDTDPCRLIPDMLPPWFHGAAVILWALLTWSRWFPVDRRDREGP